MINHNIFSKIHRKTALWYLTIFTASLIIRLKKRRLIGLNKKIHNYVSPKSLQTFSDFPISKTRHWTKNYSVWNSIFIHYLFIINLNSHIFRSLINTILLYDVIKTQFHKWPSFFRNPFITKLTVTNTMKKKTITML